MLSQICHKPNFELGTAFPVFASFLTATEKINLASTCHMLRNLIFRAHIWHTLQINQAMLTERTLSLQYLEWIKNYIERIQPCEISINLKFEELESTQGTHAQIAKFFNSNKEFVKQLTIRSNSNSLHLWMTFCCKSINKLTLHSNTVSDQLVQKMFQSFHELNQLEINADALQFTASNIENYVQNPINRLVLKPYQLNFQSILQLLLNSKLNEITEFEIDVQLCEQHLLLKIINELKCVKKLRLYHMEMFLDAPLIASKMSKQISQLTLTKCYNLEMQDIVEKISSKELEQLDLTEALQLTDNQIELLAEKAYNLKHINLSWCNQITNNSLKKLIQQCKHVQKLVLNGIKCLSDQAFTQYYELKACFQDKHYDKIRYHFKNQLKKRNYDKAEEFCNQYMETIEINSLFMMPVPQRKTLRFLKVLECNSCNNIDDMILKIIGSFKGKCSVINYYGQDLKLLNTYQSFEDDIY